MKPLDAVRRLFDRVSGGGGRASKSSPSKAIRFSDVETSFIVLGNGRTGSTWLAMSLSLLPDVRIDSEMKLWRPEIPQSPTHVHICPGDCIKERLEAACRGNKPGIEVNSMGTKLIFDPYVFFDSSTFEQFAQSLQSDILLLLLRRDYIQTWLSWKIRGVFHRLSPAAADRLPHSKIVERIRALEEPEPIHLVLTLRNKPLACKSQGRHYPLEDAIDDLLQFFANDIESLPLVRSHGGLVISYSDMEARFAEIARHIGSEAPDRVMQEVSENPVTIKLPSLDEYLKPLEVLKSLATALDITFWEAKNAGCPVGTVWRWRDDGKILINAPHFIAALEELDADLQFSGKWLVWSPRRPVVSASSFSAASGTRRQ